MNNPIYPEIYKRYIIWSVFLLALFVIAPSFPHSVSQEQINSIQNKTDNNSLSQFDQSKGIVQITKTATTSYNIVNDSTGLLGTFDTTYTITGSSDALSKSKDVIITMITSDFDKSPTIGYVRSADVEHIFDTSNKSDSSPPALPNPFVDQQTINYTISQEISNAINAAQNIKFTTVAIQCNLGMNIMDWKCKDHGIYG